MHRRSGSSRLVLWSFLACSLASSGCSEHAATTSPVTGPGEGPSNGPAASTPGPSQADLVGALGLDPSLVLEAKVVVATGGKALADVPSAVAHTDGVLLSTGGLGGAAGEDLGDDKAPDVTTLTLRLAVPPGAKALLFGVQFTAADHGLAVKKSDSARLAGAPTGDVLLATARGLLNASGPERYLGVNLTGFSGSVLELEFSVEDDVDGAGDSTLRLYGLRFSPAPIVTAEALARALLVDPGTQASSASLEVTSGALEVDDVVTAGFGPFAGSVFLSTGLATDRGLGDTDLGNDGAPDCTAFGLALDVPSRPAGDEPVRSLVFTTRFYSSEHGSAGQDAASARAIVTKASVDGSTDLSLGSVASSAGRESPSVVRALDVEGAAHLALSFRICDAGDAGRGDSGLLLSGMYFSEYDAAMLQTPRPADSRRRTGSYTWSKVVLGAAGPGLPFSLAIAYDSTPRRTSGHLGERWTHSWDWALLFQGDGQISVRRGDATTATFKPDGAGYILAHDGVLDTLVRRDGGGYVFTSKDRVAYAFDGAGKLLSAADRNGNAIALAYDASGRLASLSDSRGGTAGFTSDAAGRVTRVTYAGLEASFAYDAAGYLAAVTDAAGGKTAFTYDGSGNLVDGTDASGRRFVHNVYDGEHRVVEQVDAKGARSSNTYAANNHATRTDRDGNVETTAFDPLDRPAWTEDALGGRRLYAYDANDRRTLERDPLGFATRTAYDARGNPTTSTDPFDRVSTITWDASDRPSSRTDELGQTESLTYDARGNLLTETNPLGGVRRTSWDARGLPVDRTDRRGHLTRYGFSAAGDPETVEDAEGNRASYEHDALGRRTKTVDPRGYPTVVTYDGLGRALTVTDALGGVTRTAYDGEGRPLEETDPTGRTTVSTYGDTGKLRARTDPLGATTTYGYTGEDRLASITDALGHTISYGYALDRLTEVADAGGGRTTAEYDAAGNRIAVTDPRGSRTTFGHDALGRAVTETDPLGHTTGTTYDARGRVAALVNARGQVVKALHDAAGRLVGLSFSEGDVGFVLDANGNRVRTTDRNGTTTREYDRLNRLVRTTDRWGHSVGYRWDPAGNLILLRYSDGKEVRYEYDPLGRLVGVIDWECRRTTYTYDPSGRLLYVQLPDGARVEYGYDAAGRLVSMSDRARDGGLTYRSRYTLDAVGRRVSEQADLPLEPPVTTGARTFTYDAANQLVADDRDAFAFDADGNMTRATVGRVPVDLAYESVGRLVAAGTARFAYDGDGNRVEATVDGETRRFLYDTAAGSSRLLEERDGHGRIVARYVYGLGLVSRQAGGEDCDDRGDVSIYHFDSRGSTVALTDRLGRVTDRWAYDPWGLVVARDGDTPNPFTYGGRGGTRDDGVGLYLMGSRAYEPRLMRFLQRDGAFHGTLEDPRTLNRYAYAGGDPIRFVDPTGQWFLLDDIIMAVVGAVVNVVAQVVSDIITGEWSGWEDYFGAVVGGLVWGEASLYVPGPAAAMLGAAAGNATTQGLRIATGKQDSFDFVSFGVEVGIAGATSVLGNWAGKAVFGTSKELSTIARAAYKAGTRTLYREFATKAFTTILRRVVTKVGSKAAEAAVRTYVWPEMKEAAQVVGTMAFDLFFGAYLLTANAEEAP